MRLEELVNRYQAELNPTDLMIWKYIYNHKDECENLSIYELGKACNVSRTTIMRFAQKLSLDGFSELKAILKMEKRDNFPEKVDEVEILSELYQRITKDLVKKNFDTVNRLIYQADRIIAYGSGFVQDNVVIELKRLFLGSGKLICDLKGNSELGILVEHLSEKDLVIIVSFSGESSQVVKMARELHLRGIPVISITKLKDNTLASLSTENIYISSSQFSLYANEKIPPYESMIGYYMVIEMLFIKYEVYRREQSVLYGG
jgi:RpiR family glv operon transcriptional regulator